MVVQIVLRVQILTRPIGNRRISGLQEIMSATHQLLWIIMISGSPKVTMTSGLDTIMIGIQTKSGSGATKTGSVKAGMKDPGSEWSFDDHSMTQLVVIFEQQVLRTIRE